MDAVIPTRLSESTGARAAENSSFSDFSNNLFEIREILI